MKKTTYTAAVLATALLSGASFAETDNIDDILTGNGSVSASPSTPYVWVNSGPKGITGDVLYGKEELNTSAFSPYGLVRDDRGKRDNLIEQV